MRNGVYFCGFKFYILYCVTAVLSIILHYTGSYYNATAISSTHRKKIRYRMSNKIIMSSIENSGFCLRIFFICYYIIKALWSWFLHIFFREVILWHGNACPFALGHCGTFYGCFMVSFYGDQQTCIAISYCSCSNILGRHTLIQSLVCDLNRTPIVMAKHGGSCVHFSGISTCRRTSRKTVSHPQRL